jgi:hypothetical protein
MGWDFIIFILVFFHMDKIGLLVILKVHDNAMEYLLSI